MAHQLDPEALLALARARGEVARLEAELGLQARPASAPPGGEVGLDPALVPLLVAYASDMISVHAANGDYLYASPSAQRLFGWTQADLVGTNAYAYFNAEDLAAIVQSHAAQSTGEGPTRVAYRLRCGDGSERWVETTSQSHLNAEGIEQIFCITRDISAQRAVQEGLQTSNERLRRFAGIAAHDLKGPLTTIAGCAELVGILASDRLQADELRRLEQITRAAHRLGKLVDRLLDWALIEATDEEPVLTDLRALAVDVVSDLQADIDARGAVVELGALPQATVDPRLAGMLLQNLVGNALKFQRPGLAPRVQLHATDADNRLQIRVQDNGLGVPEDQRRSIFEMFTRVNGVDRPSGHGIGLAMCARIAERHGGRIWVEPNPSGGSTFVVDLPLRSHAA